MLSELTSTVHSLEKRLLSCFLISHNTLGDSSNSGSESVTYADKVASYAPSATTKSARSSLCRSSKLSVGSEDREENLILVGLPEIKNLIEYKLLVDEMLEFLAGKSV